MARDGEKKRQKGEKNGPVPRSLRDERQRLTQSLFVSLSYHSLSPIAQCLCELRSLLGVLYSAQAWCGCGRNA